MVLGGFLWDSARISIRIKSIQFRMKALEMNTKLLLIKFVDDIKIMMRTEHSTN